MAINYQWRNSNGNISNNGVMANGNINNGENGGVIIMESENANGVSIILMSISTVQLRNLSI
jgi:hypothetical protein